MSETGIEAAMVAAHAPHTTSVLRILEDHHPSSSSPLRGSGVTARDRTDRLDRRRDIIDHWSEALARGDDAAVERLVRQSRIDRSWVAASGQFGALLG